MLRILSFCLLVLLVACQEKPKNYTKSAKKVEPTKQAASQNGTQAANNRTPDAIEATKRFPPISAPEEYKYKEVELTGKEIPSKELKYQDGAVKGQRVAHHNGKPFTGVAIYKLPNGTLFTYETFADGIKNGPYRAQLMDTAEDGSPANTYEIGSYKNEKLDGLHLTYYDKQGGGLKKVSHYKNNKMDGQWNSYYRSGAQWTRRDFKNGQVHGKILVWDEDGILGKEYTYNNGTPTFKKFYFEE